jgi:chemotaxis protein methyltransferase CheR
LAWKATDEVRRQVHFHHFNLLAEHSAPALKDFDVIFLRNVSIYFDSPTRRLIQQCLASLLKDDGYLFTGSAETLANDLGCSSRWRRRAVLFPKAAVQAGRLGHATPLH